LKREREEKNELEIGKEKSRSSSPIGEGRVSRAGRMMRMPRSQLPDTWKSNNVGVALHCA
jgi:hypothetical protein